MPDAEARYETRQIDIGYSIITSVTREGPDVVVAIRNLRRFRKFSSSIRFNATLHFVDARRISSAWVLNPDAKCRLEPGWKVERLDFDGIVARLSVSFVDMPSHMICTVGHQIYCDDLIFERRLDIRQTLKAYFFPQSTARSSHVIEEPPASPPVEGQE